MSKGKHKTSAQIKAEKLAEAQAKKDQEQIQKYIDTTYRPDEQLVLTGEQFLKLRALAMMALQSVERNTFRPTFDMEGNQNGYSKPPFYNDVERMVIGLNLMHKQYVDAGSGVLQSELVAEVEADREQPAIITE